MRDWTIKIGGKDEASSAIRGVAKSILAMGAAYLSLREGLQFAKEAIAASANQEKQERRLWAALQQTGQATTANFEALNKQAAALQQLTTVEDDAALAAQTMFIRLGATTAEAAKLTVSAADLAAVMGGTLEQRAVLLSRALNGNTVMLERLGIHLDKTKIAAEGADYIVGELNKKFGGAAQAEVNTYTGTIKQLDNTWGDFKEVVGDTVVKSESARTTMRLLNDMLTDLNDTLKQTDNNYEKLISRLGAQKSEQLKAIEGNNELNKKGLQILREQGLLDEVAYQASIDKLAGYVEEQKQKAATDKDVLDTLEMQREYDTLTAAAALKRIEEEDRLRQESIKKHRQFIEDKKDADLNYDAFLLDYDKRLTERKTKIFEDEQQRLDEIAALIQKWRNDELAKTAAQHKKITDATKKLNDGLARIDAKRRAEAEKNVAEMMPYIQGAGAVINDVFFDIGAGTEDVAKKSALAVLNFARQALQMAALRAWSEALVMMWLPGGQASAAGLFAAAAAITAAAAGLSLIAGVASRGGEAAPTREARTTEGGRTPGYASGSSYVPATGLAMVHRGETVVPAAYHGADYPGGERGAGVTVWNVSALDARSFRDAIMREVDAALRQRLTLPDGRAARRLRR